MKRISPCLLVWVLAACGGPTATSDGGSDAGDDAGSSCASVTARLCERGLACNGTQPVISTPGASATHSSTLNCKNYYQFLGCRDAEGDAGVRDWAACGAAVEAAKCATTTTRGESIALPTAGCPGLTL